MQLLNVEDMKVKDDTRFTRANDLVKERVYTFFLGPHGPFTERVSREPFDPTEIDRRIDAIRQHLQTTVR